MYRVLSSTNTAITGIDPADEDTYVTAVRAALSAAARRTRSLDETIQEEEEHYAVVEYTDPIDGTTRWAVYYEDDAHVEIADHDGNAAGYLAAERAYEDYVVTGISNTPIETDDDGRVLPAYAETDVDPRVVAAHRAAEKAETDWRAAQAEADDKAGMRAAAVAALVDTIGGRGAVTEAARRLRRSKPIVSDLVKKARDAGAGQPEYRPDLHTSAE